MHDAYTLLFQFSLVLLSCGLVACLIRGIRGPRIADRMIAINMMSTIVIIMVCILAVLKHEGYLVDIALVYAMLSFLAVVLLTKVYIGVYHGRRRAKEKEETHEHS